MDLVSENLWETVSGSLADKLKAPARLLASLLAITIFTAVMRGWAMEFSVRVQIRACTI